jgi:hypothetical protein
MEQGLDYYLIYAATRERDDAAPEAILVEEFLLYDDYTAAGIDSAGWARGAGGWRGSPVASRKIRADAGLRARVAPVPRAEAAAAYARLGGGALPDEAEIRGFFHERQPLPAAAPLDLCSTGAAGERRYRILFAGDLDERGLAEVGTALRLEPAADPADPLARVIGTAAASAGGHTFTWELRRIGPGIAWCLDVIVRLGAGSASVIGTLLRHHRQAMRRQGLIPVTVERFA